MVFHVIALGLNALGAAVAAFGLVAAFVGEYRWPTRAAGWVVGRVRRLFGRRVTVEASAAAMVGIASMTASAEASFAPVDETASTEVRVATLERQIRTEIANRNAEARSTARDLQALKQLIDESNTELLRRQGALHAELSTRLTEQARNGLGIAAAGALLIFVGGTLDFCVTIASGQG